MTSEEDETPAAVDADHESAGIGEEDNGVSRFSDDGMETEIEVTPDENDSSSKKKRTKKRKEENTEEPEESGSRDGKLNGDVEAAVLSEITKTAKSSDEKKEDSSEVKKKEPLKAKIKNMRSRRCYALYMIVICKICVLLPIAIYACDVIIGVNVLEDSELGLDLVTHRQNVFNDPKTAPLLSVADHPYSHKFPNTVLSSAQLLLKVRSKTKRQVDTVDRVFSGTASPTQMIDSTPAGNTDEGGESSGTFPTEVVTSNKSETTTAFAIAETTAEYDRNVTYPPNDIGFCETNLFFLQQHEILGSKARSRKEKEYDWYNSMSDLLYKYQQALFFMFTVIGFIFLLTSIGTRVDAVLNQKWSSSLLVIFLLYSISMSLTAKVFALQSGSNGVRCFICRMVSFCQDIDPWDLTTGVYFPVGILDTLEFWSEKEMLESLREMGSLDNLVDYVTGAINWNTAAFVSFILKIYDCFAIGIVTLTYVIDRENDAVWVTLLKMFGWVIAFPVMVITPVAGVIRYSVLEVTIPENYDAKIAFEVIFYIGVAFWAVALAVLPFFCKTRMCNRVEEFEDEEEYY